LSDEEPRGIVGAPPGAEGARRNKRRILPQVAARGKPEGLGTADSGRARAQLV
jgi:hypothetical protein